MLYRLTDELLHARSGDDAVDYDRAFTPHPRSACSTHGAAAARPLRRGDGNPAAAAEGSRGNRVSADGLPLPARVCQFDGSQARRSDGYSGTGEVSAVTVIESRTHPQGTGSLPPAQTGAEV